jgi:hypothetical protein
MSLYIEKVARICLNNEGGGIDYQPARSPLSSTKNSDRSEIRPTQTKEGDE